MVWAALFFVGFCTVVVASLVRVGRGPAGTSITGPKDREIDYDNPYGAGTYFWTNRRSR
jgi:hypothetical protein